MNKSAQAFRTIREVADWLGVAAHVLRFWESKFPQIRPVKRAGGRRYYRPADMELVGGIKVLLHDQGLTIRGVQKMIQEGGIAAVMALSPSLEDLVDVEDATADDALEVWAEDARADQPTEPDTALPVEDPHAALEREPELALAAAEPEPDPEPEQVPAQDIAPDSAAIAEPEPSAIPSAAPSAAPAEHTLAPPPPALDALGSLAALPARIATLPPEQRQQLAPHLAALAALHERLASSPSA